MTDQHDFENFMRQRLVAARAYVVGNVQPLTQIVTKQSPATFFHPRGGAYQGAEEVLSKYTNDATIFDLGSETTFEIFQMDASDGIAYWVGIQHAQARMKGSAEVIPMDIRITEIFRREGDTWKMVHRHADPLVAPPEERAQ